MSVLQNALNIFLAGTRSSRSGRSQVAVLPDEPAPPIADWRIADVPAYERSSLTDGCGNVWIRMFGMFKPKVSDKDRVKAAIRQEFDATVAVARAAPLSKQARVGKGINDALAGFEQQFTKRAFQELPFAERKAFFDSVTKRQDELRMMGGEVSVEHIGYSLASRWMMAVAMGDDALVEYFGENMEYFKRAAGTL